MTKKNSFTLKNLTDSLFYHGSKIHPVDFFKRNIMNFVCVDNTPIEEIQFNNYERVELKDLSDRTLFLNLEKKKYYWIVFKKMKSRKPEFFNFLYIYNGILNQVYKDLYIENGRSPKYVVIFNNHDDNLKYTSLQETILSNPNGIPNFLFKTANDPFLSDYYPNIIKNDKMDKSSLYLFEQKHFYFFKAGVSNYLADSLVFNSRNPRLGVFFVPEDANELARPLYRKKTKNYKVFFGLKDLIQNASNSFNKNDYIFWIVKNGQIVGLKPKNSDYYTPDLQNYPKEIIEDYIRLIKKGKDECESEVGYLEKWKDAIGNQNDNTIDKKTINKIILNNKDNGLSWIKVWDCKEIIKEKDIYKIPRILLGMTGNQRFSRKTYAEISGVDNFGTLKALNYLLQSKNKKRSPVSVSNLIELFQCLSPAQFETLIFLIFHHRGLHCSAYQGKSQEDIDLLVFNPDGKKIGTVGGVDFDNKEKFQVKQKIHVSPKDHVRCRLVFLGDDQNGSQLGVKWLKKVINEQGSKDAKTWLKNELFWIKNVDALLNNNNEE